jgi:hypothetical protein
MADSLFHAQSQAEDLADAPTEPESDFDDDTFPF